jgi:hypothetical protein
LVFCGTGRCSAVGNRAAVTEKSVRLKALFNAKKTWNLVAWA